MPSDTCIDHGRNSVAGYAKSGAAVRRGEPRLLHRKVFLEKHGFLPPVVMHTCDNRRCVNPEHLKAGDWSANNKDRAAKGRSAKAVPTRRKITQQQAVEIRRRWALRKPGKDRVNGVMAIAGTFGVDPNVVYNIAKGKTHVA